MPFLDQLSSLLGGAPQPAAAGMTNYGVAPGSTPMAATSAPAAAQPTVLARLRQAMPSAGASSAATDPSAAGYGTNPTGVTPTLLGGNMSTAIAGGLANVKPGQDMGSAFLAGLGGALGARQSALGQSAQYGLEQQKTALDALKTKAYVDVETRKQNLLEAQAARKMDAQNAVAKLLSPGGSAAAQPAGAAPTAADPSMIQNPGAPTLLGRMQPPAAAPPAPPSAPSSPIAAGPGGGAPAIAGPQGASAPPIPGPQAGPAPLSAAPPAPVTPPPPIAQATAPMLPPASRPQIDPEADPHFLEQQANRLDQAAMLSGGYDPEGATRYANQANQIRQKAQQIRATGLTTDSAGNTINLPGFIDAKANIATGEATATELAKNAQSVRSSPSGAKYTPPPPGYVSQPSTAPQLDPPPGASINNTPAALVIDPVTAAVKTSIPAAPNGGGYPVPDIPAGAILREPGDAAKEQAKTDGQNFANLTGTLPAVDDTIQRYQTLIGAFKAVQSGSGQGDLSSIAAMAQTYGQPGLAKAILGGDPAAAQAAAKETVNLALQTVKAANPKFAQSEFNKTEEKGTPSIDNLPEANHQMISEGLGLAQRNKAFIQDWQVAQQNGWQSPSAFYAQWAAHNPLGGFVRAAQQQIGNFKGMDPPAPTDWKVGSTYVAPAEFKNHQQEAAFTKRGIAAGTRFMYNGPNSAQPLQPVGQGQQ